MTPKPLTTAPPASREARATWTTAVLGLSRLIAVGGMLITIPVTRDYLGVERFGVWMTLNSFYSAALFLDLGLGNALMTVLAGESGRGRAGRMRVLIASAYAALALIGLCGALAVLAAVKAPGSSGWGQHLSADAGADGALALLAFAAGVSLMLPLSVIQRVQLGLQQGYVFAIWDIAGASLSIALVLLGAHAAVPLRLLVVAWLAPLALAQLLNGIWYFGWRRPDLRPRLSDVTLREALALARVGLLYCVLQLAAIAAFMSDNVLLIRLLGPGPAGDYAVVQRLFSLVGAGIGLFLMPYWPAYAEAVASGNLAWVRQALRRSIWISVGLAATASAILGVANGPLLTLWLGSPLALPASLVGAFAAWTVIEALGRALAAFLNAVSELWFQVWVAGGMAATALALKFWWIPLIGSPGAIFATLAAYCAISVPALLYWTPRVMARLSNEQAPS